MTPTEFTPAPATPAQAAALGLTTLAWYALPDLVRSRGARTVLKLGLVGAGGAASKAPVPTMGSKTRGGMVGPKGGMKGGGVTPGWVSQASGTSQVSGPGLRLGSAP